MFDYKKQYRCTIIRGKAKNKLDDLLPVYANIINEHCPCLLDDFKQIFNKELAHILDYPSEKTLDNHRTEIAGKLFGMYFSDESSTVFPSERTLLFLKNNDQPEFFKDICQKFQFPNGMDSIKTIRDKVNNKISIRQFSFILELLFIAKEEEIQISKDEVAYFVLNSFETLQGIITPQQVYTAIHEHRNKNIPVKVRGKNSSGAMQHIREQLGFLKLANLVRIESDLLYLNPHEKKSIDYIRSSWNKVPAFTINKESLATLESRKALVSEWQKHYSKVDKDGINIFTTSVDAIQYNVTDKENKIVVTGAIDKIKLGDDGEKFVYNYEQQRVAEFDERLKNKVLLLGKIRGLGYDIQSIIADGSDKSEFVKYIEVKSTKRVTPPKEGGDGWIDAITLTRNEWVAGEQHGQAFSFYRVYFTPQSIIIYTINNPYKKYKNGTVKCTPMNYRLDFSKKSIDKIIEEV
ncbi:MAG: DUF3883 domain-containing protein [Cocleimonas sp.]|nr:DUF3883 domain-containing protein [Cocleimonas sp.]